MNVLITGGAGYIGFSLIETLLQNSEISEITVFDNFCRKQYGGFIAGLYKDKRVKIIHGDILDRLALEKVVRNVQSVIHLASIQSAPFATIDHHQFDQVNNWGTSQLVSVCNNTSLDKFIYISTAGVYGHRDKPAKNIDEPNPISFYCKSKLAGEKQVSTLTNISETYIFRLGTVYGLNPSMRIENVVHKFLYDAVVSRKISIDGNGEQKRPFIHVQSISNFLNSVIAGETRSEGIQSIFTEILSIGEVVDRLKSVLPSLEIIYVNQDHAFGNLLLAENNIIKSLREIDLNNLNIANFFSNYFTT